MCLVRNTQWCLCSVSTWCGLILKSMWYGRDCIQEVFIWQELPWWQRDPLRSMCPCACLSVHSVSVATFELPFLRSRQRSKYWVLLIWSSLKDKFKHYVQGQVMVWERLKDKLQRHSLGRWFPELQGPFLETAEAGNQKNKKLFFSLRNTPGINLFNYDDLCVCLLKSVYGALLSFCS